MTADFDLATLRAFLSEFDPYLTSNIVYWQMGGSSLGGRQMPALTIGGLLFVRRTLVARQSQFTPRQLTEFAQLDRQAETLFARWPVNIEKKALKEISSRLNVWASALDECAENPAACAENYSSSAANRVYLALLLQIVEKAPAADTNRARVASLDRRLRGLIVSGEFIWDAALAPAFPREEFWFLYGKPRGN